LFVKIVRKRPALARPTIGPEITILWEEGEAIAR
jgi:hypothetical protein